MNDFYDSPAATRRKLVGAKILLIDDNPDQRDLIRIVLQACMPEVTLLTASTEEGAFSQLRQCLDAKKGLPRLILLDLYLPHAADGLLIIEEVKKPDSPYRLIPITVLSQSNSHQDIEPCYDRGANSYIVKPINYDQWLRYAESLRDYWWHTVTLPPGIS